MIKEKIKREDLILYEILKNPVLFTEFVNNLDRPKEVEPFELTSYQKEMLADFSHYQVYCTARAIGKTTTLYNLILWALVFNIFNRSETESRYILFIVPSKVHLMPVWENLVKFFRTNSLGKHYVKAGSGINNSDFIIRLSNGTALFCRIAGQTDTGANVVGLHTPMILVDEAGYFPWGTFQEMQPVLNIWKSGYREVVAGVPTGLREKNVLHHVDRVDTRYSKHRVSAFENPRLSEDDFKSFEEMYGGRDTEEWTHYVLGQHGKPSYALFDRNAMAIEQYPVYKVFINRTELSGDEYSQILRKLSAIPNTERRRKVIFGIDLGFTEPTAIQILTIDEHNIMRIHARVKLTQIAYPVQEKLIDFLDSKFEPIVIGIDRGSGGQGISLIQHLTEDNQYFAKNYRERIFPVEFGGSVLIGYDADGNEIRVKTKPHAVQLLSDLCVTHAIRFSTRDVEMISELEQMSYTKTASGEIVYRTINARGSRNVDDHFTSALLCAVLAYNLTTNEVYRLQTKRLAKPSWFVTFGG